MDWARTILHVDMDAFFAAIEQLDHPELRGKPVLVGYDGPRGVVSTASYEARPFGCHSAQPMAVAKRLCPDAVVVGVRGGRYREVSRRLFELFAELTPMVEPLSIDEVFLDVTGTERLHGEAVEVARRLKRRVHDELRLTASIGLAPNKFLAKLASDMDKPDGLTVMGPREIETRLPGLTIDRMWGIGRSTAQRCAAYGLKTFGDLAAMNDGQLEEVFGSAGPTFGTLARGKDDRVVTPDHAAKSISQEQTFDRDVAEAEAVRSVLLGQVDQVSTRLRRQGLRAGTVTLKIRYGDFKTVSRSQTMDEPTDQTDRLWAVSQLLFDRWARGGFEPVRLIGMGAGSLTATDVWQMALFADTDDDRRRRVDTAVDEIKDRFGMSAIGRAESKRPRR